MQSLASEHLQELESLVGSERQTQEDTIKKTFGSMYSGEALDCNRGLVGYMTLTSCQLVLTPCVFLDNYSSFIDSEI